MRLTSVSSRFNAALRSQKADKQGFVRHLIDLLGTKRRETGPCETSATSVPLGSDGKPGDRLNLESSWLLRESVRVIRDIARRDHVLRLNHWHGNSHRRREQRLTVRGKLPPTESRDGLCRQSLMDAMEIARVDNVYVYVREGKRGIAYLGRDGRKGELEFAPLDAQIYIPDPRVTFAGSH